MYAEATGLVCVRLFVLCVKRPVPGCAGRSWGVRENVGARCEGFRLLFSRGPLFAHGMVLPFAFLTVV